MTVQFEKAAITTNKDPRTGVKKCTLLLMFSLALAVGVIVTHCPQQFRAQTVQHDHTEVLQ